MTLDQLHFLLSVTAAWSAVAAAGIAVIVLGLAARLREARRDARRLRARKAELMGDVHALHQEVADAVAKVEALRAARRPC